MAERSLKVLHTSDWHIGKKLFNNSRHEEFAEFFQWLLDIIIEREIDVLLVAGDVFDTSTPGNQSQALYYDFLNKVVSTTHCRHIVIIAGNHDSPAFLDAPQAILAGYNITVTGAPASRPGDEALILRDKRGKPELIVCAVPFLREKDVRKVEAGESVEEKMLKLHEGIAAHYARIADAAEEALCSLEEPVPVVAMGHLFTAGGKVRDGDGVRNLYIGNLGQVDAQIFSDIFDYVALGHLHAPQRVAQREHIRYSGSPLPMSFDESGYNKKIVVIEFADGETKIEEIEIPLFQKLESVRGNWQEIKQRLETLACEYPPGTRGPWVEVVYEGEELITNLAELVDEVVANSAVKVLNKRNDKCVQSILGEQQPQVRLEHITPRQVLEKCLEANQIPEDEWREYLDTFDMVVNSLEDEADEEVQQ